MIAKELNAALSDDKLREQWLKRILPALAVTVIYFVFVSPTLTEKADKADQDHQGLVMKGVSPDILPGLERESAQLKDAVQALKQKDTQIQTELAAKVGFLFGRNDINLGVAKVAQLLRAHRLRLTEEYSLGETKVSELPPSFVDLKKSLGVMLKMGESVNLHRIRFIGSYADTYYALKDMTLGETQVVPVYFDMKDPQTHQDKDIGLKAWTLDLWI